MRWITTAVLIPLLVACPIAQAAQYSAYLNSGSTAANYPVTPPSGSTAFTSLEQATGWSGDSTASVSGAYAPAVCELNPVGNGNPCPGAGTTTGGTYSGGGGGTVLDAITTGIPTNYSGWMAKQNISPTCGQLHMLLSMTFNYAASSTISEVQAFEFGRRLANCSSITDNGQMQLVPNSGQLELDHVPYAGGWEDTGCRFPMWVISTSYTWQTYYVNDSNGALSIPYVSINGTICALPYSMQHIAGYSLGWTANTAVIGVQSDAKPTSVAASFDVTITDLSAHTW